MERISPSEPTSTHELDSDFHFLSEENVKPSDIASKQNKLKPRERVFLARLGATVLAAAFLATSAPAVKSISAKQKESKKIENPNPFFKPIVEVVSTSPKMSVIEKISNDFEEMDRNTKTKNIFVRETIPPDAIEPSIPVYPEELDSPEPTKKDDSTANGLIKIQNSNWDGPVLNAKNGHINGPTGDETYYDLPMEEIVARMHRMGYKGEYWEREDGVKMLGDYVMVAANLTTHPRGSIVETSLGTGIVCDTGSFAKEHPNRLDIATNWTEH